MHRSAAALETTPLLTPQRSNAPPPPPPSSKGQCWCCWETDETEESGTLIRVCRGCRDKDLQWVHQTCIDKYLSALPIPAPLQVVQNDENQESHGEPDLESQQPHHLPSSATPSTSRPHTPSQQQQYMCTRCTDTYNVIELPIHPLRVLAKDWLLMGALIIMTPCVLTVLSSCLLLMFEHSSDNSSVVDFPSIGLRVSTLDFSIAVLGFCTAIYAFTWKIVIESCQGRSLKHVVGIDEMVD